MKKAYTDLTYDVPWIVKNITQNKIVIWLNFSDPQTISQYSEKDNLLVRFEKGAKILTKQETLEQDIKNALENSDDPGNLDIAQLLLPA